VDKRKIQKIGNICLSNGRPNGRTGDRMGKRATKWANGRPNGQTGGMIGDGRPTRLSDGQGTVAPTWRCC